MATAIDWEPRRHGWSATAPGLSHHSRGFLRRVERLLRARQREYAAWRSMAAIAADLPLTLKVRSRLLRSIGKVATTVGGRNKGSVEWRPMSDRCSRQTGRSTFDGAPLRQSHRRSRASSRPACVPDPRDKACCGPGGPGGRHGPDVYQKVCGRLRPWLCSQPLWVPEHRGLHLRLGDGSVSG